MEIGEFWPLVVKTKVSSPGKGGSNRDTFVLIFWSLSKTFELVDVIMYCTMHILHKFHF